MALKQVVITSGKNSSSLFHVYRNRFLSHGTIKSRRKMSPTANTRPAREVGGTSLTSKAFTLCLHPPVLELDWLSPSTEDDGPCAPVICCRTSTSSFLPDGRLDKGHLLNSVWYSTTHTHLSVMPPLLYQNCSKPMFNRHERLKVL